MATRKLSELVLDFDFYPRRQIDSHHVGEMRAARQAGTEFPPLVIDKKSKRIVDGFHRYRMHLLEDGAEATVECVEKTFKSDAELFLVAVRFNASHGRCLSAFDKAHAAILAKKIGVSDSLLATALQLTVGRLDELKASKTAVGVGKHSPAVAIKRTIGHMAGKRLSEAQQKTNTKLGGMNQLFYVNQLVMLIESDLIDKDNTDLIEGLRKLHTLLGKVLVA